MHDPLTSDSAQLLRLDVEALFRSTPEGRLIESNETPPAAAPRVFVGRTATSVEWRVRRDVPDGVAAEIGRLAADLPHLPNGIGDAAVYAAIEAVAAGVAPIAERSHGPAFVFAQAPLAPHPDVIEIREDSALLAGQFAVLRRELEYVAPLFAVVRDGAVVSACFCARRTDAAAEAGVSTHPDHRGRGHAAAVVNAWRVAIERSGRTPIYSTSYDNASSRAVARRLGLRQYAETFSLA
ncbi:GNAT family N-acetyltransferase [Conexibacter woesei]|uniref:GNAT family N-acetyltransferase n=1 Tax=Conexibacter woesei TaxID=191495 RepID=UPI0003052FFA|nr:GNAT family N-acetyltransferase [Conexibacter woesei]